MPASGEEIWVAIATQAADGRFVEERLRDVPFRLVLDVAGAELREPRADRPCTASVLRRQRRAVRDRAEPLERLTLDLAAALLPNAQPRADLLV